MAPKCKPSSLDLSELALPQKLENLARSNPGNIDTIIVPFLLDPALPKALADLLYAEITTRVTPELNWGGDPVRKYFPSCCIHATLLGRAYALLTNPVIVEQVAIGRSITAEQQMQDLWKIMSDIFIKAFFSGPEPEAGSRFAAGVLILGCGKTLSQASGLKGIGMDFVWYYGKMDRPDEEWDWETLKKAVLETKKLPRDKTDPSKLRLVKPWPDTEYIPQEVLDVLDKARDHLWAKLDNMSSEDIRIEVYRRLFM